MVKSTTVNKKSMVCKLAREFIILERYVENGSFTSRHTFSEQKNRKKSNLFLINKLHSYTIISLHYITMYITC